MDMLPRRIGVSIESGYVFSDLEDFLTKNPEYRNQKEDEKWIIFTETMKGLQDRFNNLGSEIRQLAKDKGNVHFLGRTKRVSRQEREPLLTRMEDLKTELQNYYRYAPKYEAETILLWLDTMGVWWRPLLGLFNKNYSKGLSRDKRRK